MDRQGDLGFAELIDHATKGMRRNEIYYETSLGIHIRYIRKGEYQVVLI